MQQLNRNGYDYLQVFRMGSQTRQKSKEYLESAKKKVLDQRSELDFSKLLDQEMRSPVFAAH